MMCHHSSPSSCGPEGRAWRKNDGAFEFLPKNMPDGSAAAAIPADQTVAIGLVAALLSQVARSEEHTSELQSLMRISYAVSCFKKKQNIYHSLITKEKLKPK